MSFLENHFPGDRGTIKLRICAPWVRYYVKIVLNDPWSNEPSVSVDGKADKAINQETGPNIGLQTEFLMKGVNSINTVCQGSASIWSIVGKNCNCHVFSLEILSNILLFEVFYLPVMAMNTLSSGWHRIPCIAHTRINEALHTGKTVDSELFFLV